MHWNQQEKHRFQEDVIPDCAAKARIRVDFPVDLGPSRRITASVFDRRYAVSAARLARILSKSAMSQL
jgi:hypothetical protein